MQGVAAGLFHTALTMMHWPDGDLCINAALRKLFLLMRRVSHPTVLTVARCRLRSPPLQLLAPAAMAVGAVILGLKVLAARGRALSVRIRARAAS